LQFFNVRQILRAGGGTLHFQKRFQRHHWRQNAGANFKPASLRKFSGKIKRFINKLTTDDKIIIIKNHAAYFCSNLAFKVCFF